MYLSVGDTGLVSVSNYPQKIKKSSSLFASVVHTFFLPFLDPFFFLLFFFFLSLSLSLDSTDGALESVDSVPPAVIVPLCELFADTTGLDNINSFAVRVVGDAVGTSGVFAVSVVVGDIIGISG